MPRSTGILPSSGADSIFWSTNAQPELALNLTHNLVQPQQDHVTFELECIDRMYLNAYVPKLTSEGGIAAFCRGYRYDLSILQAEFSLTQVWERRLHGRCFFEEIMPDRHGRQPPGPGGRALDA